MVVGGWWMVDGGWVPKRLSDFAGTLHSFFCCPVCSRLRSNRGVPGASPTCCDGRLVVDGGWWMVDGGGGWAGSENRKKSCILKISRKLFDIFF